MIEIVLKCGFNKMQNGVPKYELNFLKSMMANIIKIKMEFNSQWLVWNMNYMFQMKDDERTEINEILKNEPSVKLAILILIICAILNF